MIYVPKHYQPFELVDRATYAHFRARDQHKEVFRYFDAGLLKAMDWIYENYPCKQGVKRAIHVNDWYWNPQGHEWRGLRNHRSADYKPWSAHTGGRAIDFEANGCDDQEMQAWILGEHNRCSDKPEYFGTGDAPILYLRRMEVGTAADGPRGWTHVDTLEHSSPKLLLVSP